MLLCLFRARMPGLHIQPFGLFLFAASPILLLISGFHGNSDPIMMFFVLLSLYFMEVRQMPAVSGAVLGLAMGIKIAAIIFAAALLFSNRNNRDRLRFILATAGAIVVSSFPYIVQNPLLILQRLSHYSSLPMQWGWPLLLATFADSPRYHWISDAYMNYGKASLLVMLLVLSIMMNRRRARLPLLMQCGVLAFFFVSFTPGFGVQYLAWLTPWTVVVGSSAVALYNLTAGTFLTVVYTHWCRGFPWYYANAYETPVWSSPGLLLGLACWFMTGVLLLLLVDAWLKWKPEDLQ